MKLILASTSPYRAAQLKKAGVPFTSVRPSVNEDELKSKLLSERVSSLKLAEVLSYEKGKSVWAAGHEGSLVISGDQVAECDGQILGKPGSFEKALQQLQFLSGRTHRLITAVTLFSGGFRPETHVSVTELKMRRLSEAELTRYLKRDTPYDCAGSYKIEENGIALFESIVSDDFTAIQGIPMIWLCNKLKEQHFEFFQP